MASVDCSMLLPWKLSICGNYCCVHRADWKSCQVDGPAEQARTESFKALFQPYDVINS